MGYFAAKLKKSISASDAQKLGKVCTKYCKEHNISIQQLTDARYGNVNAYPEEVIDLFV